MSTPPTTSRFIEDNGQEKVVIFIHGITGDADKTWLNKSNDAYWPTLIAEDPDFEGFDVYVVSYRTPWFGTASNIEEVATNLLGELQENRFFDRFKQIYFICHSMGGLIAKRILNDLNRKSKSEMLRLVRAVLFLSTPAQGSPLARIVAWLTFNPQFADLRSVVSNAYLQSLDNQWEDLLRDRDIEASSFPKSFCAYEVQKTWGISRIVNRVHMRTRSDENPRPMEFDHEGIAKPFNRDGNPYQWAKDKILGTAGVHFSGRTLPRADPSRFSIGVMHLVNDAKGEIEQLILEALDEFKGIQISRLDRKIEFDVAKRDSVEEAHIRARRYLAETGVDAAIWGNVLSLHGKVIPKLYWTTSQANFKQQGTRYCPTEDLSLPEIFWNDLKELLHLLVISQYATFEEQAGHYVADQIKPFLDKVKFLLEKSTTQKWSPQSIVAAQSLVASSAITYGQQSGDAESLRTAVQLLRKVLHTRTRDGMPLDWAMTQNNLGIALATLGKRETGTVRLQKAVRVYRDALQVRTRERVPLEWATTQNNLANALTTLGKRETGTARLKEAVRVYRAALEECTRVRAPLDWAKMQTNLGNALLHLGERESGTIRLEEALSVYEAALQEYTLERAPLNWATTQNNIGIVLSLLGKREMAPTRLEKGVLAFRAALQVRTRDRVPLDWAMTQDNLGSTLATLGERETRNARLEEAVGAYREALQERTQERAPLEWASTQNNLGNVLRSLGEREAGTDLLKEAVEAFRAALQVRTRDRVPLDWAMTQNNLANALAILGQREIGPARLEAAVKAYRAALQVRTRKRLPLDWALTQSNLGNALRSLGEREAGTDRLEEAVEAHRAALQECTRDRTPLDWARMQTNLGMALATLGERETGTARLEAAVEAYRAALTEAEGNSHLKDTIHKSLTVVMRSLESRKK